MANISTDSGAIATWKVSEMKISIFKKRAIINFFFVYYTQKLRKLWANPI